jgi:2,3,4,5-tetrahydropyridine-2-carboxylate N-succinyltransferase
MERNEMNLEDTINLGFDRFQQDPSAGRERALKDAVRDAVAGLDAGKFRVAEKHGDAWVVQQWLKKAVLLHLALNSNRVIQGGFTNYYDKVTAKFAGFDKSGFVDHGVRVVPPAVARHGSYIAPGVVLMPCYVNIGAYIDRGTMVDTWATVGSCAQIGRNVHLSGGVGIGGVLEPLQASPTIIEDNCFIGARSEIVEGVVVGEGSVISMGVYIGQSTKIFDRRTGKVHYGSIPPGSVVVPGSLPAADGSHGLYCAVIVKQVDERTRSRVGINVLLRDV